MSRKPRKTSSRKSAPLQHSSRAEDRRVEDAPKADRREEAPKSAKEDRREDRKETRSNEPRVDDRKLNDNKADPPRRSDGKSSETVKLDMLNREELIHIIRQRETLVTFIKKNGDERVMRCTLCEDDIPEHRMPGNISKISEDVIAVYDLDNKDWRSFRIDAIVNVSFPI